MSIEDKLMRLTVKIESRNNDGKTNITLGSGVIWNPQVESEYTYVFTAAHVVHNKKNLIIRYLGEDQLGLAIEVEDENVAIHHKFDKDNTSDRSNDIAVIKCSKIQCDCAKYCFKNIKNTKYGRELYFRGFPKEITEKSFILQGKYGKSIYEQADGWRKKFHHHILPELGIDATDRNEELKGFSGMGLFVLQATELVLLGIHSYGVGENAALATVAGMNAELICEVCEMREWDIPQFYDDINGDLSDCIDYFLGDIENENIRTIMDNIIMEDLSEVIRCDTCNKSIECEKEEAYFTCTSFRNNLLILLCILRAIQPTINLSTLELEKGDNRHSVKYVCSEGRSVEGRIAMKHFIHSLKIDYLNCNNVKENSLIVWNSKEQVKGKLTCDKERFGKILCDIKTDIRKDSAKYQFDVKKGYPHPSKLSIIHISQIKDFINEDSYEEAEKLILDIL